MLRACSEVRFQTGSQAVDPDILAHLFLYDFHGINRDEWAIRFRNEKTIATSWLSSSFPSTISFL